jgi:hypothetical protein
MKLSELIATVGDEVVEMQNLDQCAINLQYNIKSGTKILFGTEQAIGFDGTEKLGLIIWLPRDKVKNILGEIRATEPTS